MTGRIGAMAMDGTPISATDVARMEADEVLHTDQQRKAVRVVAGSAHDVDDCRLLLSILGLDVHVIGDSRRAADPDPLDIDAVDPVEPTNDVPGTDSQSPPEPGPAAARKHSTEAA